MPYAGLVDSGVILLKDSSIMAGWYFAGQCSESSTDGERNDLWRKTVMLEADICIAEIHATPKRRQMQDG